MRRRPLLSFVLLATILLSAATAAAQESAFREAEAALKPLRDRSKLGAPDISKQSRAFSRKAKDSNATKNLEDIFQEVQIQTLAEKANRQLITLQSLSSGKAVPTEYAESIRQNAALLTRLDPATPNGMAILAAVSADLSVKTDHATKARDNPFDPIEVTVRTLKEGIEREGYAIYYVPEPFKEDSDRYEAFPRFSSPTSDYLPAGRYVFWASRGGANGESRTLPIGNGTTKEELDLNVP